MHAFIYSIYKLKIISKINFRFKLNIYIYHVSKKSNFKIFFKNIHVNFMHMKSVGLILLLEFLCRGMYVCFKFFFLNIAAEEKIKTPFNLYHTYIKHKPLGSISYAEIEYVFKSHTCFVIFFFKSRSKREEAFS